MEYIKYIDVSRLIYLDEMSVNIGMTRLYGRSLKGERIVEYVPDVRYKRVSAISTVRVSGENNPFAYSGTLNGFMFMQYMQIKSDLREQKPRSVEAICKSLTFAFYSVTPQQAQNHFTNAILDISHQP